jgi:hypothetical protein
MFDWIEQGTVKRSLKAESTKKNSKKKFLVTVVQD